MIMQIKNTAPGLRGVHTLAGQVWIEPGQTVDVEVSDAEAPGILAHPDLEVAEVADKAKEAAATVRRTAQRSANDRAEAAAKAKQEADEAEAKRLADERAEADRKAKEAAEAGRGV